MTEPTYRIETSYDAQYEALPWSAHVYRLTDDSLLGRGDGNTEDAAVMDAIRLIERLNMPALGKTLYVDEHGMLMPPPAVTPESRRA